MLQIDPGENSLHHELVLQLSMKVIWPMNAAGNEFSRVLSDSGAPHEYGSCFLQLRETCPGYSTWIT